MWQKTIGGLGSDILNTLQQTIDGGYILGGLSYSGISGDKTEAVRGGGDYWVVKLNATGVISWQRTLGGNDIENLYSVRQTADSGYVLEDIRVQIYQVTKRRIAAITKITGL